MSEPTTLYPTEQVYFPGPAPITVSNPSQDQAGYFVAWWIYSDLTNPVSASGPVAAMGSNVIDPPPPEKSGTVVAAVVVFNTGWGELQVQQN